MKGFTLHGCKCWWIGCSLFFTSRILGSSLFLLLALECMHIPTCQCIRKLFIYRVAKQRLSDVPE